MWVMTAESLSETLLDEGINAYDAWLRKLTAAEHKGLKKPEDDRDVRHAKGILTGIAKAMAAAEMWERREETPYGCPLVTQWDAIKTIVSAYWKRVDETAGEKPPMLIGGTPSASKRRNEWPGTL